MAGVEGVFPDGSMLVSAWVFGWAEKPMIQRDEHGLARYDATATHRHRWGVPGLRVLQLAGGTRIYPYRRETIVVVVGDRYHIVDTKHPVIRAFDATGKLVGELQPHMPLEPTRLTRAGRDSIPDLEGIDRDDLPRFYPFHGRPQAAGGMLWVPDYKGHVPDGESAWTVYSEEGDLVGRVTSSEVDIRVLAVDDDIAVVCGLDEPAQTWAAPDRRWP